MYCICPIEWDASKDMSTATSHSLCTVVVFLLWVSVQSTTGVLYCLVGVSEHVHVLYMKLYSATHMYMYLHVYCVTFLSHKVMWVMVNYGVKQILSVYCLCFFTLPLF